MKQNQEIERLVKEFYEDLERNEREREKEARETVNQAINIVHDLMVKFDELLEIMRKLNEEM